MAKTRVKKAVKKAAPKKAATKPKASDEKFAKAREAVLDELVFDAERDDHSTDTDAIFELARLAHDKTRGDEAREIVLGGWTRLIEFAKKQKRLMNSVAYNALAFATVEMPPHPSIGPALHEAFRVAAEIAKPGGVDVHYNLNCTCGPLAIAMMTIGYRDVLDDIAKFFERFDHYDGTPFHTQVLYARWMLEEDAKGANNYLAESEQIKVLGWAAAALADLDHKPGRGTMIARMGGRLYAESREALMEASARLRTQDGPPEPKKRMIWMFGRVSPVEIALGNETDNEFRMRAEAKRR